ncbi:MAG: hypothetical protein RBT45_07080 [Acholeplasmataceae bacterium]|nr:hypothetical protein [Acholeplasmataceae bacterium]
MFEKINSFYTIIQKKFDIMMHRIDLAFDAFFHALIKIVKFIGNVGNKCIIGIYEFYQPISKFVRLLSMPWGILIIKVKKLLDKNKYNNLPIFLPGMHMIRSRVGGGKSLTSLILAEMTLKETGYPSYFTSAVEKPQLSEDGKYWYVMHPVVKMSDYYQDGKKVLNFNTEKYKNIHKDERHLQYNPRMNKSSKYNDTFIPEHEDHLLMRHDGFDNIFMYSQHMKLDAQDMDSITLMHEVETYKDIPLKRWIDDGRFNYIPIKLKFVSYSIEVKFDGSMDRKFYRSWNLEVPYDVLMKFDTYAEKHKHAGLPKDFK